MLSSPSGEIGALVVMPFDSDASAYSRLRSHWPGEHFRREGLVGCDRPRLEDVELAAGVGPLDVDRRIVEFLDRGPRFRPTEEGSCTPIPGCPAASHRSSKTGSTTPR